MKSARDFDDLDAIDTELSRLRDLVESAFEEGWNQRDTFEQANNKVRDTLGWTKSKSKTLLEKE